jgi:single-stranded-DNA-specific exonuclease
MEPFGVSNPEPIFVSRNITIVEKKPCKNPAHVQVTVRQAPDRAIRGIAFHMGERLESVPAGSSIDLMYKTEIDNWRGRNELKLKVEDFA